MTEYGEGTEVAGRFVILDRLGEGGMGAVFRALQTSLDREVALKVLHSKVAFTPRARRRFGREARAVARLNHPHIAGVFDFGADNDDQTLWLAMELVEGTSMTGLKRENIEILRLLSLTDQVLSALSAAHARGIIHRDLKPSNILLTVDDDGREIIKLVDFGLAATQEGELSLANAPGGLGDELTETAPGARVIMGTPRYMAPEIFRRKPVDPRVDLYALGVILFELLVGTPPYPGDDPREVMKGHLKKPIPKLVARDGVSVPTELERIIYGLLAKDPEERYQSASEVRDAIQYIINEFSYVPWATGPTMGDMANPGGGISSPGFLSAFGGQTIPPAAMLGGSRPGVSSPTAPLVGRNQERRTIEQHIRRTVSEGAGGLLTIEGEEGVGKTRIAQWVRVRVDESGLMRPAEGSYSKSGGGFDGVRSVLDALLGTGDVSYDEIPLVIESRLARWSFGVEEIQTCIQLMKPGGEEVLFDGANPVSDARISRQERVFAVIEKILRHTAEERPLLMILENLHHAGETTFAFLEHLAVGLHLTPAPMLVVATVNSDEIDNIPELKTALVRLGRFGTDFGRLNLERLNIDEATALVQKLVPLDDGLARRIAERSGGNPLHLTQILRYLQESQKMVFESGAWVLQDDVDIMREVPEELGEMMRYRADRMVARYLEPEAATAIIERCAILGRRFDYRLLRAFVESEGNETYLAHLDSVLEFLVKENILREVGHSAEDVLEFNHAIMRDVLLNDMRTRRSERGLQSIAAETKVAFYGNRVNQYALEISEHYREARDPNGVYVFIVKAARYAMSSSDLGTAIRLYREAMALAEKNESVDDQPEAPGLQEISAVMRSEEVSLQVAHIELKIGEYEQARDHYRAMLRSPDPTISSWARWGLGQLAIKVGQLDEADGWFDAALRELEKVELLGLEEEAEKIRAHCLFGVGTIVFLRGEYNRTAEVLPDALELAQRHKERLLEGDILRTLSDVMWNSGDADRSEIYRRRATLLAESAEDNEALAQSMLHASGHLRQIGQPRRAEEQAQAALELYEDLGKRHAIAHGLLERGYLAWCRGEFKPAASSYREAHRLFEAFEDRRGMTRCKLKLAELALSIKKYKEAQTLIRDSLDGFRQMSDRLGIVHAKMVLGRVELESENIEEALNIFDDGRDEMEQLGNFIGCVRLDALRAICLEKLARHDEVDQVLDEIFESVKRVPVVYESFGWALEELSELLSAREPDRALELNNLASEAYRMLGRAG